MGKHYFITRPAFERDDVIRDAIEKCRDVMFKASYPSTSYADFMQKCKDMKEKGEDLKDVLDYYYLPQKLHTEILEDFLDAYRFPSELKETIQILEDYCKKPIVEKHIVPKDGSSGYRGYSQPEPMSEECFKETKKYLDMAGNFFKWNRDESAFRYALADVSPSCNRSSVEKYHHEHGEPDFRLPDEDYWVDPWDESYDETKYEDEDFVN